VKDLLNYPLLDQVIPEASKCKYLQIILCRDLSWTDHVNYTAKKAWKALHDAADTLVWGCVLGSVQGGTDKSFRLGAQESGKICRSYQ
jgi:hypothetical protein